MKLPTPRHRPCLKCGRTFRSAGSHNRLCARCNRENLGQRTPPTVVPKRNGVPMRDIYELLER